MCTQFLTPVATIASNLVKFVFITVHTVRLMNLKHWNHSQYTQIYLLNLHCLMPRSEKSEQTKNENQNPTPTCKPHLLNHFPYWKQFKLTIQPNMKGKLNSGQGICKQCFHYWVLILKNGWLMKNGLRDNETRRRKKVSCW